MSAQFLEHGEDPNGMARRSNRQRLLGDDANYDDDHERSQSFVAERDASVERNAPVQQAEPGPDPYAVTGIDHVMNVDNHPKHGEMFNSNWLNNNMPNLYDPRFPDLMRGRRFGGGGGGGDDGMLHAAGEFGGSPIEQDLLKADQGQVFDRSKPAGPAAGWDRLNQSWLGAFFGGIFGGKGRAFRNQQQAQRRKMVGDAFNRGGEMPEWVRNSRYGQRKWNQLLRAGRR